ncbi:hypothetical protein C9374_013379 [Naegleria lovaniensis]|uniref:DNA-directed DNA polymerase family A palm domain-containing protein n=1 Tax=Naegleria lovaniensis TaxID=51637 RepID=A0AA88H180_NAELO|nr:uncharacterized protein C9374_013379 [Naegleria lovaniensis]KAG2391894.1 hypothetical protein C9374_013379 [Naegleria lovaniensis]
MMMNHRHQPKTLVPFKTSLNWDDDLFLLDGLEEEQALESSSNDPSNNNNNNNNLLNHLSTNTERNIKQQQHAPTLKLDPPVRSRVHSTPWNHNNNKDSTNSRIIIPYHDDDDACTLSMLTPLLSESHNIPKVVTTFSSSPPRGISNHIFTTNKVQSTNLQHHSSLHDSRTTFNSVTTTTPTTTATTTNTTTTTNTRSALKFVPPPSYRNQTIGTVAQQPSRTSIQHHSELYKNNIQNNNRHPIIMPNTVKFEPPTILTVHSKPSHVPQVTALSIGTHSLTSNNSPIVTRGLTTSENHVKPLASATTAVTNKSPQKFIPPPKYLEGKMQNQKRNFMNSHASTRDVHDQYIVSKTLSNLTNHADIANNNEMTWNTHLLSKTLKKPKIQTQFTEFTSSLGLKVKKISTISPSHLLDELILEWSKQPLYYFSLKRDDKSGSSRRVSNISAMVVGWSSMKTYNHTTTSTNSHSMNNDLDRNDLDRNDDEMHSTTNHDRNERTIGMNTMNSGQLLLPYEELITDFNISDQNVYFIEFEPSSPYTLMVKRKIQEMIFSKTHMIACSFNIKQQLGYLYGDYLFGTSSGHAKSSQNNSNSSGNNSQSIHPSTTNTANGDNNSQSIHPSTTNTVSTTVSTTSTTTSNTTSNIRDHTSTTTTTTSNIRDHTSPSSHTHEYFEFNNLCFDPLIMDWMCDTSLEHKPKSTISDMYHTMIENGVHSMNDHSTSTLQQSNSSNKNSQTKSKKNSKKNSTFSDHHTSMMDPSNILANDSYMSYACMNKLYQQIMDLGLTQPFIKECYLIPIIASMEYNGVGCNVKQIDELSNLVTNETTYQTRELQQLCGSRKITLTNKNDIQYLLYDVLQMKTPSLTCKKGAKSTNKDCLRKLSIQYPQYRYVIESIQLFRKLQNISSKFTQDYKQKYVFYEKTCSKYLIHSSQEQNATSTGRISSRDPNLQALPKPLSFFSQKLGKQVTINSRSAITATSDDCILVSADFSQIEVRLIAHFSQDATLLKIFSQQDGIDIFKQMASALFATDYDHVTDEQRSQMKTLTYGIIYGMGDDKLSIALFDSTHRIEDAKRYRYNFFQRFKGIEALRNEIEEEVMNHGYVTTIAGRRRHLSSIWSPDSTLIAKTKRQSFNSKIQGSAADIIKEAIRTVWDRTRLEKIEMRLLLQIHDEILFEVRSEKVEQAKQIIKESMESCFKLSVPTPVVILTGTNWGDLSQ